MSKYYVYQHIRLDTQTPFYVGKGKGSRSTSKYHRNPYWKNIVDLHGYRVEFLEKDLSEEQAFFLEKNWIAAYRLIGQCEANLTLGGEGASGHKHSCETLQKIKKVGPANGMFGKKRTLEERNAVSKANTGRLWTPEHKTAHSLLISGNSNPMFGKSHKIETIQKIRDSKIVNEVITPFGIFTSYRAAAENLGLHKATIFKRCKSEKWKDWSIKPITKE